MLGNLPIPVPSNAPATRPVEPPIPFPSGQSYRVVSPPQNAPVTRALAAELGRVLERFAREAGFSPDNPVTFTFRPGIVGHHQLNRAADIYAVGGVGIDGWYDRWRAHGAGGGQTKNLGFLLYEALRRYGRWAQPYGYPIQLFGPWTREIGPWIHISDSLLRAHRDHIHVAR